MGLYDSHQAGKGSRGYKMSNRAVTPSSRCGDKYISKDNNFRSYVRPISASLRTTPNNEESLKKLELINLNAETIKSNVRDMSIIYEFFTAKKDYARVEGLIDDIVAVRKEVNRCIKYKSIVSDSVIKVIPEVKKDLDSLEKRIRKTLRENLNKSL